MTFNMERKMKITRKIYLKINKFKIKIKQLLKNMKINNIKSQVRNSLYSLYLKILIEI